MRVAIDGPAGSGKSTVARALARRCGLTYLDTGAMYRSVTEACLEQGVSPSDAGAVADVARGIRIEFGQAADGTQTVSVDGRDYTKLIRTPQVDRNVSAVSAIPAVREAMVAQQRAIGAAGDVVAEGRDIGTVVFPDAEVKVFLTADPEARAHRRAVQRAGGDAATDPTATADAASEQQILADLERRDQLDSSREVAPLRPAPDAVRMDSSSLTVDEEVERIMGLMDAARAKDRGAAVPSAGGSTPVGGGTAQSQAEEKRKPKPEVTVSPNPQPQVEGRSSAKPQPKAQPKPEGRLRAFHHNAFADYYEHGMRQYPLPARALLGFLVGVVGAFTKIAWPWRIENGDSLWEAPEGSHGRVIVMNHTSMLDPIIVIVTEWVHGRRVRAIYKSEFDSLKIATWLFSRAGAIPVERGTADIKAVRRAQAALQRGEDVLIYPEGTRVKSDDEPVTLHAGFALMAQLGRADVLPMAIVGARDITTRTRKVPHFHRVFCKVGEPIGFSGLGVKGRKRQAKAMEDAACKAMYALRDELRAEHPGKE